MGGDGLITFLSGALTATYLVAAAFFLRFWRRTQDRLFLGFATAFGLLALGRVLIAASAVTVEQRSYPDMIRVAAFLVILVTIILSNLRPPAR
jgi:NhaP-type Na+/H+ or K+/H+ antiporter